MSPDRYAITFACYNALPYTKLFVESLMKTRTPLQRVVAIDNHSSDETLSYLHSLGLGSVIANQDNYGCGVAWNQGIMALQAEWTIIMNNDVIVSDHWVENLIETAERKGLKIISPALIEGELNYDFESFSKEASKKLAYVLRPNDPHAVCFAIHQSVWKDVGLFRATPKLIGFEDTIFFHEARVAGILGATTGASWLHHFGSITQSLMKAERGLQQKDALGNRYNYRLLQQSWWQRKLEKIQRTQRRKLARDAEFKEFGMSLHGIRNQEAFTWL